MNAYIKYIAPISLSALLIACGSGGGKGENQPSSLSQSNLENNPSSNLTSTKPSSKEQDGSQSSPTNQSNDNKTAKPAQPNNQQNGAEKPILNQPTSDITTKPLQPNNQQGDVVKPIINLPSDNTTDKPTLSTGKELEKPVELILNKPDEEKINIPSEINKAVEKWFAGGGSEYDKNQVRIYRIIENDKNEHDDDLNIKEIKPEFIQLAIGTNYDNGDYAIKLLDENFYYGYYRDSVDKKTADIHYIYSFKESAENKGTLSGLNATYHGEFIYTVKSIPNLPTRSNVYLKYENGEAMGKVTSIQDKPGRELFHINSDKNNIRTLIFNPAVEDLDNSFHEKLVVRQNSPDRIAIDTHFINGQDGTPNKHLVGKGQNDKYWGVLGAKKVE